MRFTHAGWFVATILVVSWGTGSAQLPPPGATATSSATQVISPVALVTWVTRYGHDGVHVLDLLVLWRGTPGWFMRASGAGTSAGGNAGSFHSTIRYGGVELELGLESQTRVARIQDKKVELRDANVILVDHVDTAKGPQVVGTMRVDPAFPRSDGDHPRIEAVLRRSPEILSFLRCDTALPDGKAQAMIDRICAQLVGK